MKKDSKKSALTLVLNGGSNEMDSATIPIKWFFSEELIKQAPKYLVLCEQSERELRNEALRNYSGRRYVFNVENAIGFIEIPTSGDHKITCLPFSTRGQAIKYLQKENNTQYIFAIDSKTISEGGSWGCCLEGGTVVDFSVPKELFAQPPQTKIGKLFWKYLFWPKKPKPQNECVVRRNAIFFALPKLIPFLVWQTVRAIVFLLYLCYMFISPAILLFFGFKPIKFKYWLENVGDALKDLRNWEWDVKIGSNRFGFGRWKRFKVSPFHIVASLGHIFLIFFFGRTFYDDVYSYFIIWGSILVLALFGALIFYRLFKDDFFLPAGFLVIIAILVTFTLGICASSNPFIMESKKEGFLLTFFLSASCFFILILLLIVSFVKALKKDNKFLKRLSKVFEYFKPPLNWLKRLFIKTSKSKSRAQKKTAAYQKRIKEYKEFLSKNFTTPESKVNLHNLPKTFENSSIKRTTKVIFWAVKRKVCRPYDY